MKEVKCNNDIVLRYDDKIKVGDLISTYHAGIWRLDEIEERKGNTPIFHYTRLFDAKGAPSKTKKEDRCDAFYCRKASDFIKEKIDSLKAELSNFVEIAKICEK